MAAIALPPPAANNAGFLALYNQVPLATTNQIERDIWDLTQIDVHEFGRNYIQNLSQATYNALPIVLQDTIAAEVHTVGVGAPSFTCCDACICKRDATIEIGFCLDNIAYPFPEQISF